MYLDHIYSPADIKKLSFKELNDVSNEIRAKVERTWRAFRT